MSWGHFRAALVAGLGLLALIAVATAQRSGEAVDNCFAMSDSSVPTLCD